MHVKHHQKANKNIIGTDRFFLIGDPHWFPPECPVARVTLHRSEQRPCHSGKWGCRLLSVLPASSAELILYTTKHNTHSVKSFSHGLKEKDKK